MSDPAQDPNAIPMAVPVEEPAMETGAHEFADPAMAVPTDPALAVPSDPSLEVPTDVGAAGAGFVMPEEAPAEPSMNVNQPIDPEGFDQPAQSFDAGTETFSEEAIADPAMDAAYEQEDMTGVRPVPRVSIQAFCETPDVASIIERAAQDRRMSKAHVSVHMGGIPAATDFYQTAATPNLIIVETQLKDMEILHQLQGLAEVCDEGSNVMIVGHANDVNIYRELMARGVSEYLVAPISMVQLMTIVNELFVNPESEPLGHTLAFIGAKGGVGSSTIAHNVAFGISSEFESDVLLADMDLPFGTANIDFDQDPAQGISEAVFSADRVDDTYLDRLLAKCSDHLSLLAAPSTLERDYDFQPEDFRQIIDIAQRTTPNVVLDIPHVWTGWARNVLAAADKVIITATPDLASLRNTKNLIDTLAELRPNDGPPYIVLNQVNVPKRPEISVDDFMEPLEREPTAVIPWDPALFGLASNNGQMIVEADAKSEIAATLSSLAHILTNRRETAEKPGKRGGSLLAKLGIKRG